MRKIGFTCTGRLGAILGGAMLLATTAQAAINISTQATQNMSCIGGVCTATAQKAYLNVNDVTNFLSAGDLKVVSGAGAEDIHIQAPFSWTSTSRLTLDAQRSIEFEKPVSVAGTGALTLTTNDGGSDGDYWFDEGASVSFWDTSSSLIINGQSLTLVTDIQTLASDIAQNNSGAYALAQSYDAVHDGTYAHSPISAAFSGVFEGLGNMVSDLAINDSTLEAVGFFSVLDGASVENLHVRNAYVVGAGVAGTLAGLNKGGTVRRCTSNGTVSTSGDGGGGLVGNNSSAGPISLITLSRSSVKVFGGQLGEFGGLVGMSGDNSLISESFANGPVVAKGGSDVGGLAGLAERVENSYATGSATLKGRKGEKRKPPPEAGGLVGYLFDGQLVSSYSTGRPEKKGVPGGGLVGVTLDGTYNSTYWDVDSSQTERGCARIVHGKECPPVGLTDQQLKSVLPTGFNPLVWGLNPGINNGYPYLLANPARKGP